MNKKNGKALLIKAAGAVLCFLIAFVIMLQFYQSKGYAPFGGLSLAIADGDLQYLDFFAYLKNVFEGKDSLLYSYNKELGGNAVGMFSYYLASPVNLLMHFFDITEVTGFIDIAIAVKLGLAAAFFFVFLSNRYAGQFRNNPFGFGIGMALSLCYTFCQYNIAQCSNIMWLDGVYMLPLILLGVYYVANGRKEKWLLSLTVAASILLNWYTAGMNCFFSIVWFLVEFALREPQPEEITITLSPLKTGKESKKQTKQTKPTKQTKQIQQGKTVAKFKRSRLMQLIGRTGSYLLYMALGVMLSMILFLPTIISMSGGSRGGLQLDTLLYNRFENPFPSIIKLYRPGAQSAPYEAALYAGVLPVIGMIGAFLTKKITWKNKLVYALLLVFLCLMFYWFPLISVFSMFRWVGSYWYRYGYLGSFILIFIAAEFFFSIRFEKKSAIRLSAAVAFGILVLTGFDMKNHAGLLMDQLHSGNVEGFAGYITEGQKQIGEIKAADQGVYRIGQTANRGGEYSSVINNEGLSLNYMGITGYSSTPNERQVIFLTKLGYRNVEYSQNIIGTCVLPADSLLAVRYVLSPRVIKGLEKVDSFGNYNGKDTYWNPYALPFAFTYRPGEKAKEYASRFLYVNELYSELCGEDVAIYEPVAFTKNTDGNSETYSLRLPEGNYSYYGNIPFYRDGSGSLNVNNAASIPYTSYTAPSVFHIPVEEGATEAFVTLSCDDISYKADGYDEFAALNLDTLREVSWKLQAKAVEQVKLEHKKVTVEVPHAEEGESLYLALPYDSGWKVYRNGKEIKVQLVGECMYSLPLEAGANTIELRYRMNSVWIGVVCSLLAAAVLVCLEKKRRIGR